MFFIYAFFDTQKSIVENLDLLSGPILALLGLFVFFQIRFAKKQVAIAREQLSQAKSQLVLNSKRDSIKLAGEQLNYYASEIFPLHDKLYNQCKTLKFELPRVPTTFFIKEDLAKLPTSLIIDVNNKLEEQDEILETILSILNKTETFATYFIQKVADENIAFLSIGYSYCNSIEKLSYIISLGRSKHQKIHFYHLVELYNLWNKKLNSSDLQIQKELIEKELKTKLEELNKKITDNKAEGISPFGTK